MANRLVIVPEDLYKGMLSSAASKHTSAYQVKKAMSAANPENILAADETGLNLTRKLNLTRRQEVNGNFPTPGFKSLEDKSSWTLIFRQRKPFTTRSYAVT